MQGVPGQTGAFDPGGKLPHAGECGELAQDLGVGRGIGAPGHHLMEVVKQPFRLTAAVINDAEAVLIAHPDP